MSDDLKRYCKFCNFFKCDLRITSFEWCNNGEIVIRLNIKDYRSIETAEVV